MKWISWSPTARNLNSCSLSINAGTCNYHELSVLTKKEFRNSPLVCPWLIIMIYHWENHMTSSSLISKTVTTISSPSHGSTLKLENSYKSPNTGMRKENIMKPQETSNATFSGKYIRCSTLPNIVQCQTIGSQQHIKVYYSPGSG